MARDGFYISEYVNRKEEKRVQVLGTKEQFEEAGLDLDEAEEHKPGRFNIRGRPDEMAEIVAAAEAYNDSLQEHDPEDIFEWMDQNRSRARLLRRLVKETEVGQRLTKGSLEAHLGLSRPEVNLVMSLMFADGWIDPRYRMRDEAGRRLKEWRRLQKQLREE